MTIRTVRPGDSLALNTAHAAYNQPRIMARRPKTGRKKVSARIIALVLALWLVPATAPAADQAHLAATMDRIQEWVQGRYDNTAQAAADEANGVPPDLQHREMHQFFVPVDIPAIPGHLVFQQASADGSTDPELVFRAGLLQFLPDEDSNSVRQRELYFKDTEAFKNAHLSPGKLASLTLDDFEWDPGCDFYLLLDDSGERVSGPIGKGTCRVFNRGLNKDMIAEDEVVITADQYWFLGRFVDENGEVLWGNASDEHIKMNRVAPVEAVMGDRPVRHILIFGATRNTGLEAARILAARGDRVTALVRPGSDRTAIEAVGGIEFAVGDALNAGEVRSAFDSGNFDAVITTLGCYKCESPPDYIGNRNVFDAAGAAGVDRVIMVSTIGAGDSSEAIPWIVEWFLDDVIELKEQAEQHLIDSGVDYTIIRPGGLKKAEATGNGMLSADPAVMGLITRPDLAALIVDTLDNPEAANQIYSATDPGFSWPWDMF